MYPPDGLLTLGDLQHDVAEVYEHITAPDPFSLHPFASENGLDDYPDDLFLLTTTEPLNTMSTGEDEPSIGLNGRLRPRKAHGRKSQPSQPDNKTQENPKILIAPSNLSNEKQDDLANKSDFTHSNPQQFLCPCCDKKFATKQTLSKHAKRMHFPNSKRHFLIDCDFCNHSEVDTFAIIRHMVDSHPNQYFACLDCHTRFNSTSELAEHKTNVCEKLKDSYRNKLRQKVSTKGKKSKRSINISANESFGNDCKEFQEGHGFNGIVISCELKPSQVHDEADIEDNITTNLILPPNKNLCSNSALEKNAVIILDDLQWNKRLPPNFSFHNTDADQILSRLGVVHRSPRTGESSRKDWFKIIDQPTQKFERCFDTSFYSKVAGNVHENISRFLDGSFNFNPDPDNSIKTRKFKNSVIINTAEGFPILLASEQSSRNGLDDYVPRSDAPKHKWKWGNNAKHVILAGQVKRDSHTNNCIVTVISCLDIWTQLCMRRRFEESFGTEVSFDQNTEKQSIVEKELKDILESRELPSKSQVVKYKSTEVAPDPVSVLNDGGEFPAALGLVPAAPGYTMPPAVLSGECVRPRCYVCCACGVQTRDSRALSAHILAQHPNAHVQHYEIVGEPLLNADILKHLYVPPSQMGNRTRPPRGFKDCTKCNKSISLEDLHQHMLDCAGDTPTVRRRQGRYRPFGVRKRRTRMPDNTIRKKIRKDIRSGQRRKISQKSRIGPRPRVRTEVGDAETIRKMLADLPAKRHRVLLNPSNPISRPHRTFDKQIRRTEQRSLLLKKRSPEDSNTRKKPHKDWNNTLQTESNVNMTMSSKEDDEDNKPLKYVIDKSLRQSGAKKRKPAINKLKKKSVRTKEQNQSSKNDEKSVLVSSSTLVEKVSLDDTSQKIDVKTAPYNTREHANRGGSNSRGSSSRDRQRSGGSRSNGNANGNANNNNSPAQNAPLKHSIAQLTANLERHDKSVQFHQLFLVQQECNNTDQHVSSGQQTLFEDEAVVTRLDKPPLNCNQKIPLDLCSMQKNNKTNKPRKGLDDCIAMLMHKLGDPNLSDAQGQVSVQCGREKPIEPQNTPQGEEYTKKPELLKKETNQEKNEKLINVSDLVPTKHTSFEPQTNMTQDKIGASDEPGNVGKQKNPKQSKRKPIAQTEVVQKASPELRSRTKLVPSCEISTNPDIEMESIKNKLPAIQSESKSNSTSDISIQTRSEKNLGRNSQTENLSKVEKIIPTDAQMFDTKTQTGPIPKSSTKDLYKVIPSSDVNLDMSTPTNMIQRSADFRVDIKNKSTAEVNIQTRSKKKLVQKSPTEVQSEVEINRTDKQIFDTRTQTESVSKLLVNDRVRNKLIASHNSLDTKAPPNVMQRSLPEFHLESRSSPTTDINIGTKTDKKLVPKSSIEALSEVKSIQSDDQMLDTKSQTGLVPKSLMEVRSRNKIIASSDINLSDLNQISLPEFRLENKCPSSVDIIHETRAEKKLVRNSPIQSVKITPAADHFDTRTEIGLITQSSMKDLSRNKLVPSSDMNLETELVKQLLKEDQSRGIPFDHVSRNRTDVLQKQLTEERSRIKTTNSSGSNRSEFIQNPLPEVRSGGSPSVDFIEYNSVLEKTPQTFSRLHDFNHQSLDSSIDLSKHQSQDFIEAKPVPVSNLSWQTTNERAEAKRSFIEENSSEAYLHSYESEPCGSGTQPENHDNCPMTYLPNAPECSFSETYHYNYQSDIPPAHASTNVESILLTPLDLSGKIMNYSMEFSNHDYNNYEHYDTYETLDLSYKSSDKTSTEDTSIFDDAVDLSVKPSKSQYESSTIGLCVQTTDQGSVTDLSLKNQEVDTVPTDLSVRGQNIMSETASEVMNYVQDLSSQKSNFPENECMDLTISEAALESFPKDWSGKVAKENAPVSETKELNYGPLSILKDNTADQKTMSKQNKLATENKEITQSIHPRDAERYSAQLLKHVYDTTLKMPQYQLWPTRSKAETMTGEVSEFAAHDFILSNKESPSKLESVTHFFGNVSFASTVNTNAEIDSIYTLPSCSKTATVNKIDNTLPVYTLSNACISVSSIEPARTTILAKNFASIPETDTTSLSSITSASLPSSADRDLILDKNKISTLKQASSLSQIKVQPDKNNAKKDADALNSNQDPDIAKKIAMLPKELVEILGSMPVDHRNQLLNVLPQYVSTSTVTCDQTEPIKTVKHTNTTTALQNAPLFGIGLTSEPEQHMHCLAGMITTASNLYQSQVTLHSTSNLMDKVNFNSTKQFLPYPLPTSLSPTATPPLPLLPPTPPPLTKLISPPPPPPLPPPPSLTLIPPSDSEEAKAMRSKKCSNEDEQAPDNKEKNTLDTFSAVVTKRSPKANECAEIQDGIIDLTDDENIAKVTEDQSHCTTLPSLETSGFKAVANYNRQKGNSDQTASLRAVRIKAPSERHKVNQLLKLNLVEQVTKEPDVSDDNDAKSAELIKYLAIQQAEVSSTQHSNKIALLESKLRLSIPAIENKSAEEKITNDTAHITTHTNFVTTEEPKNKIIPEQNPTPKSSVVSSSVTANKNSADMSSDVKIEVSHPADVKLNKSENDLQATFSPNNNLTRQSASEIGESSIALIHLDQERQQTLIKTIEDQRNMNILEDEDSEDDISLAVIVKLKNLKKKGVLKQKKNMLDNGFVDEQTSTYIINKKNNNKDETQQRTAKKTAETHEKIKSAEPIQKTFNWSDGSNENCKSSDSSNTKVNTERSSVITETFADKHFKITGRKRSLEMTETTKHKNLQKGKENENCTCVENHDLSCVVDDTHNVEELQLETTTKKVMFKGTVYSNSDTKLQLVEHNAYLQLSSETDDMAHQSSKDNLPTMNKVILEKKKKHVSKTLEVVSDSQDAKNCGTCHKSSEKQDVIDKNLEKSLDTKEALQTSTMMDDSFELKTTINDSVVEDSIESSVDHKNALTEQVVKIADNQNLHSTDDDTLHLDNEAAVDKDTPVRRSRRGKSLFVDNVVAENIISHEAFADLKTPITKKQLIFSKLLQDEENLVKKIELNSEKDNMPEEKTDNICMTDNLSCNLATDNISEDFKRESFQYESQFNSKKRKKLSQLKGKCKKKKSLEISPDSGDEAISDHSHNEDKATSCEDHGLSLTKTNIGSIPDGNSSNTIKEKDSTTTNNVSETVNKREILSEKRKIDKLSENAGICQSSKAKQPRVIKYKESNVIDSSSDSEIETDEVAIKESKIVPEKRSTTCYSVPIAARRTRSKSVVVKPSGSQMYDPYDIDLDDMIVDTEPLRKDKKEKNCLKTQNHDVFNTSNERDLKSNKVENTLDSDTDSDKIDISKSLKMESVTEEFSVKSEGSTVSLKEIDKNELVCKPGTSSGASIKPTKNKDFGELEETEHCSDTGDVCDSDESSRSDVPLKNYIKNKKTKQGCQKDINIKNVVSDKSSPKKRKQSCMNSNNVETTSSLNETEEQLRSEQFMESFGFFSERKPRKSNLLATKKISETFQNIANVSDDLYFGVKGKSSKRALQNDNKKTVEKNVENPTRHSSTKKSVKQCVKKNNIEIQDVDQGDQGIWFCAVCERHFLRNDNLSRHKLSLYHVAKVSQIEMKLQTNLVPEEPNHLVAYMEYMNRLRALSKTMPVPKVKRRTRPRQFMPPAEEILEEVEKILREQQLRKLSRDEALFLECCSLLSESDKGRAPKSHSYDCINKFTKCPANCTASKLREKQLLDEKPNTRSDDDVDSITAQNILESEEVRTLENDLISGLKEAATAKVVANMINQNNKHQSAITDRSAGLSDECNERFSSPNAEESCNDQVDVINNPDNSKNKKQGTKNMMFPDSANINMLEDKFDKIKRKCRSQAAAAKQTQALTDSSFSLKERKKSDKKKGKKSSKKNNQSTVLTKGALKGFDGIKVSIPTSDINISAIVPSLDVRRIKKKRRSKKKRDKRYSESSSKSESHNRTKDIPSTQKKVDVYEFKDNEEVELFEFRPSTLMERFKSISKKDIPSTLKLDSLAEEAEKSCESASDGDDFVYMSDDYVCSDDETESSFSCELGNVKGETKKILSPLKRKDVVEKNAVMGRIFRHNAVRCEKKISKPKEPVKPKANLDQLFDSLLEEKPSSSMLIVDAKSSSEDNLNNSHSTKQQLEQNDAKSVNTAIKSSKTIDLLPQEKYEGSVSSVSSRKFQSTSTKDLYGLSPIQYTSKNYQDAFSAYYGPSTSKADFSSLFDYYGPSTSSSYNKYIPRDNTRASSNKHDSSSSNKHGMISPSNDKSLISRERESSFDLKEKISNDTYYFHTESDVFDDTGVARQRARRKCAVGKQNVLAETWSSESEPDGLPPRPNSAESVISSVGRKKKGRKKDSHQGSGRRGHRHVTFKKQDVESSRLTSSSSASSSTPGRSIASSGRSGGYGNNTSGAGADRRTHTVVSGDMESVLSDVFSPPAPVQSSKTHVGPSHGTSTKGHLRADTYNWSSEGDEEQETVKQHGWIVGDSHKKLVTMLAHAKGRKRNNDDKRHLLE